MVLFPLNQFHGLLVDQPKAEQRTIFFRNHVELMRLTRQSSTGYHFVEVGSEFHDNGYLVWKRSRRQKSFISVGGWANASVGVRPRPCWWLISPTVLPIQAIRPGPMCLRQSRRPGGCSKLRANAGCPCFLPQSPMMTRIATAGIGFAKSPP